MSEKPPVMSEEPPVMSEEPHKPAKSVTIIDGGSPLPFGLEAKPEHDVDHEKEVDKEEEEEARARKIAKKVKQEIAKEELVADFTEAFHLFDIENEGFINPRKLFSALIMLGYHPTEAEIQDLIGSVDKDGNGEISLDEFLAMMFQAKDKTLEEEKVRETFCVFDTDENDVISVEDIEPILIRMGYNLSRSQLEKVIAAADINGDGVVTFEDFLAVYNQKQTSADGSEELKNVESSISSLSDSPTKPDPNLPTDESSASII